MTNETLKFMHRSYIEVAEEPQNENTVDIISALYDKLSSYQPPEDDSEEYDIFLRNLDSSLRIRKKTFALTSMVSDIVFAMIYIAIWANVCHGLDIDINLMARRKALESELTKLLTKDNIHDRFGIRGIVLNNTSEEIRIEKLYLFSSLVINILTKSNRKDYNDFLNWVKNHNDIDTYTKERLYHILDIPFKTDHVKDYIKSPKSNGYQSLHFVLMSEMYSDILPGAEFEVQFRTIEMHQHAANGKYNHLAYKAEIEDDIKAVFRIEDFSKVHFIGFKSYDSIDDDIDGFHYGKTVVNRRISHTLLMQNDV